MAVFPSGQGSYIGVAQQAGPIGWGGTLVAAGLKTFPNLSGSDVISANQGKAERKSISTAMARSSQTYSTMSLVNVRWATEFVTDATAWQPVLLAAFGKRTHAGASSPYTDTYTVTIPNFDAGTDGTPADPYSVYNHSLSFHAFISDGTNVAAKYSVKDVIITQYEWAGTANGATDMSFQGTGRNLAASASTVTFSDQTGTIMSWNQGVAGTNSGFYLDTATPPTTAAVLRSFRFTLNNPHDFLPALGAASGSEMRTPIRSGPTTAAIALDMLFEDAASGSDAVTILTDFIAGTNNGILIKYYSGTTDYVNLACHGSVDPVALNDARISWGPTGPVGFNVKAQCYPDTITDLSMVLGTSSTT